LIKTSLTSLKAICNQPKVDPAQKQAWADFVKQLIEAKKQTKYMALVTNGLYVNSLDARMIIEAKNKLANFKYATLDYASIPDAKVTLTDDDYKHLL
jgi:peptidyl-prolyl cis-trans isomerase D